MQRALHWTEGFGGRECPYLADHHGAVIWHGVHGAGQVVLAAVAVGRPGHHRRPPVRRRSSPPSRQEARRWAVRGPARRHPAHADGADYQLYWGDLHRHSLVSRCTSGDEPSLEDFYRYAWDVNEYDFWAVTDHAENSTAYQWWSIQKIADLLHVPGRFVPLYGFEWTSAEHGHQNVIYGDVARGAPIFSAFAEGSTTPDGLWRGLAAHPRLPGHHHPAPPRLGHGAQRLGLPRSRASAGSSRCSRRAGATTSRQSASGSTPTAPPPAPSCSTGCCAGTASASSPPPTTGTARATSRCSPGR